MSRKRDGQLPALSKGIRGEGGPERGKESRIVETRIEHRVESWSGLLPPPEALESYQKHIPDVGVRLLEMSELEQRERHARMADYTRSRDREQTHRFAGLIALTTILLSLVGVAVYLIAAGHPGWTVAPLATLGFCLFFARWSLNHPDGDKAEFRAQVGNRTVQATSGVDRKGMPPAKDQTEDPAPPTLPTEPAPAPTGQVGQGAGSGTPAGAAKQ